MRHLLSRPALWATCAVLSCSFVAPAAAEVDPAVLEAIKKVKQADHPSANAVTIVTSQQVVYQTDGQFTNTMRSARLVLTSEGKKQASSRSLYYTKDAEKMEVLSAQVIKPDGTVVPVPAKDIQDTEQSGEMNIYDPEGRALKVTFANLAVGDAVDITYKLTRMTPTRVGHFNDIFPFQNTEPMLAATYTIDGPAAMPLVTHVYHPSRTSKIATGKTKAGDRILYKWSVKNVPQLVPEPGMNYTTEMPLLVVTTDPSWHNFAKWWAQLVEPQMTMTPELKDKVKELVKDAKNDDEKIRKIYDFVAQDIRYRGLGVGPRTGYTPRTAHETMTSRWGVCRDVSILMTAMLRDTGIDAYPVLTNVGDPVLPKIAYDGFNHAIVAVKNKTGGWTYMDPTAKNNNALLPGNEAEQDTLIATLKGAPLSKIPAADPSVNLGHAIANTTIGADGSMTSKVTLKTKGMFDLVVRSVAAMMSEDQQKEIVESLLHHSLPDAQLVSFSMTSALALFTPMEVDIEIKVPDAAPKTGDYRLLRTIVTSGALGLVENVLPQLLGQTPTRKYGLDAQVTFQYDQTETITVPAGTKILALPNPAKASNSVSQLSSSCTKKDATTITCQRSFALKSRHISPAQYSALRTSVASLAQIARQPVILAGGK
jgi:transglutaminase-like putative cysteine protease